MGRAVHHDFKMVRDMSVVTLSPPKDNQCVAYSQRADLACTINFDRANAFGVVPA